MADLFDYVSQNAKIKTPEEDLLTKAAAKAVPVEPDPEIGDYFDMAVEGAKLIPGEMRLALTGAAQGREGAATYDPQDEVSMEQMHRVQEYNKAINERLGAGFLPEMIQAIPNVGYSAAGIPASIAGMKLGAMGGAAAGTAVPGVGTAVGAGVGAFVGGMAAGVPQMARADEYRNSLELLMQQNETLQKLGEAKMDDEQSLAYLEQYKENLHASGMWEALPEQVSTIIDLALVQGMAKIPGGKAMLGAAIKAAGKLGAGILASEWPMETLTEMGQSRAMQGTPLAGEDVDFTDMDDWLEKARQTLPGVLTISGTMAGGGTAYNVTKSVIKDKIEKGAQKAATQAENEQVASSMAEQALSIQNERKAAEEAENITEGAYEDLSNLEAVNEQEKSAGHQPFSISDEANLTQEEEIFQTNREEIESGAQEEIASVAEETIEKQEEIDQSVAEDPNAEKDSLGDPKPSEGAKKVMTNWATGEWTWQEDAETIKEEADIQDREDKASSELKVDGSAFRTAARQLYIQAKNLSDFTKKLVESFGTAAKKHALKLWNSYKKSRFSSEQGAVGDVENRPRDHYYKTATQEELDEQERQRQEAAQALRDEYANFGQDVDQSMDPRDEEEFGMSDEPYIPGAEEILDETPAEEDYGFLDETQGERTSFAAMGTKLPTEDENGNPFLSKKDAQDWAEQNPQWEVGIYGRAAEEKPAERKKGEAPRHGKKKELTAEEKQDEETKEKSKKARTPKPPEKKPEFGVSEEEPSITTEKGKKDLPPRRPQTLAEKAAAKQRMLEDEAIESIVAKDRLDQDIIDLFHAIREENLKSLRSGEEEADASKSGFASYLSDLSDEDQSIIPRKSTEGHKGKSTESPEMRAIRLQERRFDSFRNIENMAYVEVMGEDKSDAWFDRKQKRLPTEKQVAQIKAEEKKIRKNARDLIIKAFDELTRNKSLMKTDHGVTPLTADEVLAIKGFDEKRGEIIWKHKPTTVRDMIIRDLAPILQKGIYVGDVIEFILKEEGNLVSFKQIENRPPSLDEVLTHFTQTKEKKISQSEQRGINKREIEERFKQLINTPESERTPAEKALLAVPPHQFKVNEKAIKTMLTNPHKIISFIETYIRPGQTKFSQDLIKRMVRDFGFEFAAHDAKGFISGPSRRQYLDAQKEGGKGKRIQPVNVTPTMMRAMIEWAQEERALMTAEDKTKIEKYIVELNEARVVDTEEGRKVEKGVSKGKRIAEVLEQQREQEGQTPERITEKIGRAQAAIPRKTREQADKETAEKIRKQSGEKAAQAFEKMSQREREIEAEILASTGESLRDATERGKVALRIAHEHQKLIDRLAFQQDRLERLLAIERQYRAAKGQKYDKLSEAQMSVMLDGVEIGSSGAIARIKTWRTVGAKKQDAAKVILRNSAPDIAIRKAKAKKLAEIKQTKKLLVEQQAKIIGKDMAELNRILVKQQKIRNYRKMFSGILQDEMNEDVLKALKDKSETGRIAAGIINEFVQIVTNVSTAGRSGKANFFNKDYIVNMLRDAARDQRNLVEKNEVLQDYANLNKAGKEAVVTTLIRNSEPTTGTWEARFYQEDAVELGYNPEEGFTGGISLTAENVLDQYSNPDRWEADKIDSTVERIKNTPLFNTKGYTVATYRYPNGKGGFITRKNLTKTEVAELLEAHPEATMVGSPKKSNQGELVGVRFHVRGDMSRKLGTKYKDFYMTRVEFERMKERHDPAKHEKFEQLYDVQYPPGAGKKVGVVQELVTKEDADKKIAKNPQAKIISRTVEQRGKGNLLSGWDFYNDREALLEAAAQVRDRNGNLLLPEEVEDIIRDDLHDLSLIELIEENPSLYPDLIAEVLEAYGVTAVKNNVSGLIGANKPVYTEAGVNVLRKEGNQHYGNPWNHEGHFGTIKTETVKEAVDNYKAWLEGTAHQDVKPEQRAWIMQEIANGKLDGKKILYYADIGEKSHADVLAEYIGAEIDQIEAINDLKWKIRASDGRLAEAMKVVKAITMADQMNRLEPINPEIFDETSKSTGIPAAELARLFQEVGEDKAIFFSRVTRKLEARYQKIADDMFLSLKRKDWGGVLKASTIHEFATQRMGAKQKVQYEKIITGMLDSNDASIKLEDRIVFETMRQLEARLNVMTAEKLNQGGIATFIADQKLEPTTEHLAEKKVVLTPYEQELSTKVGPIYTLRSSLAQNFYAGLADTLGADLVIISNLSPGMGSKYIPTASDGRSKVIVNLAANSSFHNVFAHEIFHTVVNRASKEEYDAFVKGLEYVINTKRTGAGKTARFVTDTTEMDRIKAQHEEQGLDMEEFHANLFAKVMSDPRFFDHLSKTAPGKTIAQRIFLRLLKLVKDVDAVIRKTVGGTTIFQPAAVNMYEGKKLFENGDVESIYELFTDLIFGTEKSAEGINEHSKLSGALNPYGTLNHQDEKHFSAAVAELKGYAKVPLKPVAGLLQRLFSPGTKSYKDLMTNMEGLITDAVAWFLKHKGDFWFAHVGADKTDLGLAEMVAHAGNTAKAVANAQTIRKHKDVFKGWTDEMMRKLHDDFVRGVEMVIEPNEEVQAQMAEMLKENDWLFDLHENTAVRDRKKVLRTLGKTRRRIFQEYINLYAKKDHAVTKKTGGIDVSTQSGRSKARKLGYKDDVIEAFAAYKKISDEIHQKLVKIYPDMAEKYRVNHYGQSLIWMRNGSIMKDSMDAVIQPEFSQLEGSKNYLKGKNTQQTTNEIAEENNLRLTQINPHKVFLKYVEDTSRLIALYEMINKGTGMGRVKIFSDAKEAADQGFRFSEDPALIIKQMNLSKGFKVLVNGDTYWSRSGQEMVFSTKEDAQAAIDKLLKPRENTNVHSVSIEAVKPDVKLEKYKFTVYRILEDGQQVEVNSFKTEDAANEFGKGYGKEGVDYIVKPAFLPGKTADVAQIYFKEDLAKLMDIILAKDWVRNGSFMGIKGQWLLNVKNHMTSLLFALSLFHVSTIGQEVVATNKAWAYRRYGKTKVLKGLGNAYSDSQDIHMMLMAVLGDHKLANDPAIQKKLDELFGTTDVDVLDVVMRYFAVGGLDHMDTAERASTYDLGKPKYYQEEDTYEIVDGEVVFNKQGTLTGVSVKAMMGAIGEVWDNQLANEPDKKLKAMFNTARFAFIQQTTAWLMETGIPKAKMAMWAREYTLQLDLQKDALAAGTTTKQDIAREAMLFVEDKVGEVNWLNKWMKPAVKTSLMMSFNSFTWFTGAWSALGKAGIDIGKKGWFTLKQGDKTKGWNEQYVITDKGTWFFGAIAAHLTLVQLINLGYLLAVMASDDDEVPTPEDTPYLTRFLFPRYDPSDPEARLAIPSYITELYKLSRHIGVLGDEPEPTKLISGRLSTPITGAYETFWTGTDFAGTLIRNPNDSLAEQAFDSIVHTFGVLPISISSAKQQMEQKGWRPEALALGLAGFVSAPAAAKRSDAANYGYHLSRGSHTTESTEEEMDDKLEIRRAAAAAARGDKQPLEDMLNSGQISKRQYRRILKKIPRFGSQKNPLYVPTINRVINILTVPNTILVIDKMTEEERKVSKRLVEQKYANMVRRKEHGQPYMDAQKDELLKRGYDI